MVSHRDAADVPQPERAEMRLLLTVTEAAHALGLGRSLVYELVTAGEIASIKIGRARRIPVPALEAFVRDRLAAQGGGCEWIEQRKGTDRQQGQGHGWRRDHR